MRETTNFFVDIIKSKRQVKKKNLVTWYNLHFLFAVNVILNLSKNMLS